MIKFNYRSAARSVTSGYIIRIYVLNASIFSLWLGACFCRLRNNAMIYMHSSLRAASASLIQTLSQEYKTSFAARCVQVWQWYTSHADGYVPSRAQVKTELGLSDYIITKCLRALERLHLAVLDITRERGKPGCWRVFKQPVQDAPRCGRVRPIEALATPKTKGSIVNG